MSESLYPVPASLAADARVTAADAARMHAQALADPDAFWRDQAQRLDWITPFTKVDESSFNEADFGISWFADGQLNVSANCIDRHLAERGDQPAIIWEGDNPGESRVITYAQLHEEVCRFANVLKEQGVRRGDRVTLYLPMIPEAAFAMLACTRIGAVHSIVFGGFSPDSLASRIRDCDSRLVITADEGLRGGKAVPLKANVDAALAHCTSVETVLVVQRTGADVPMVEGRDLFYGPARDAAAPDCPAEAMGAEDPLFILYTSGSTGTPKGVLHSTGGYLLWAAMTHAQVFDYRPGEVY
ncbi:MAG: AMP-binding protein, partial [Alphaproteobacteria bacterium]